MSQWLSEVSARVVADLLAVAIVYWIWLYRTRRHRREQEQIHDMVADLRRRKQASEEVQ